MTDYVTLVLNSDSNSHRMHLVDLVNQGTFELRLWGGDDDYITNFDMIELPGCWEIDDIEVKPYKRSYLNKSTEEWMRKQGYNDEMIRVKLKRVS